MAFKYLDAIAIVVETKNLQAEIWQLWGPGMVITAWLFPRNLLLVDDADQSQQNNHIKTAPLTIVI